MWKIGETQHTFLDAVGTTLYQHSLLILTAHFLTFSPLSHIHSPLITHPLTPHSQI